MEESKLVEKHFKVTLSQAIWFCRMSDLSINPEISKIEQIFLVKSSILSSVILLENAANLLLDELDLPKRMRDQADKMSIIDKYEFYLFFFNDNSSFDRGCKETKEVQELISFRNTQVHIKRTEPIFLEDKDGEGKTFSFKIKEISNSQQKLPNHTSELDYSHALSALKSVEAFLEKFLLRWCGFDITRIEGIFADYTSHNTQQIVYVDSPDYDLFMNTAKEMGLGFSFLIKPFLTRAEEKNSISEF